jgi:hypothetical protein
LRALTIGEILDGGFTIYREHFGRLVGISVVFLGVPTLLGMFVEVSGGALDRPGLWFLSLLLFSIGWLPGSAAIVWSISEAALGREPQVGTSVQVGFRKMLQLFVAGLAAYLIVLLGLLALVIPGLIVACGYSVVVQAVVLEDLGAGTDALGRSWKLTKGYKAKALGLIVVVSLLISVPYFAAGVVAAMVPAAAVAILVLAQVVSFLVTPLFACMLTLFYYDLRVRQEGFDLEHLGRELGFTPANVA